MKIKLLDARLRDESLKYMTAGAAGFDLRACLNDVLMLAPDERVFVPCGFAIHIEDRALCGLIYPRSGLGSQGLVLANTVGVIDSDYQGEIGATLWNTSKTVHRIMPMDRIAQMVITPVERISFEFVDEFEHVTKRGTGGHGSTGKR